MKAEYDLSKMKSRRNPYASKLKSHNDLDFKDCRAQSRKSWTSARSARKATTSPR
jgi:hypothetical protein